MSIRIVLADDHRMMREGLRSLLAADPEIEVVGEAGDGRTALAMIESLLPDVAVVDVSMPGLNGIEVARQARSAHASMQVVALSMHTEAKFVNDMLKAGALAYLSKDAAADELLAAVRAAVAGKIYLGTGIANVVLECYVRNLPAGDTTSRTKLTPRESEVLQAMTEGLNTKQVAQCLHVSTKTVETHRRQIMDKLGIYSLAQLTKYAIREGLTPLDG